MKTKVRERMKDNESLKREEREKIETEERKRWGGQINNRDIMKI